MSLHPRTYRTNLEAAMAALDAIERGGSVFVPGGVRVQYFAVDPVLRLSGAVREAALRLEPNTDVNPILVAAAAHAVVASRRLLRVTAAVSLKHLLSEVRCSIGDVFFQDERLAHVPVHRMRSPYSEADRVFALFEVRFTTEEEGR